MIAGWWYARNWLIFGDPLALSAHFGLLAGQAEALTLAQVWEITPGIWRSFWAVFGWFNVAPSPWLYTVYDLLCTLGTAGLITGGLWHWMRNGWLLRHSRHTLVQILLLLLWLLTVVILVIRWAQISSAQGRLLFPALSAAAPLLAWGLLNWLPARGQRLLTTLLLSGLFGLAVLVPWQWIAPAYAAPPTLPLSATLLNPQSTAFGPPTAPELRLRGWQIQVENFHPGGTLLVELNWQAINVAKRTAEHPLPRDYSVFVHLTDEGGILQAQNDSWPAAGSWPTSVWPADKLIIDRQRVFIPPTVPSTARLRLDVGVYDHATGVRLPVGQGDFWTLGYISMAVPGSSQ